MRVIKHSVTIRGHATSFSLEPMFMGALKATAEARGISLAGLVAEIDETRSRDANLSSAIRIWLFERAMRGELPPGPVS